MQDDGHEHDPEPESSSIVSSLPSPPPPLPNADTSGFDYDQSIPDDHDDDDQQAQSRQWEPRSSTPMAGTAASSSSPPPLRTSLIREPSPLSFGDGHDQGQRTPTQPHSPEQDDRDDFATPRKPGADVQPQPPLSAWKNMPGFEDLDESWVEPQRQSSDQPSQDQSSPSVQHLQPGPVTDDMRKRSDAFNPSSSTTPPGDDSTANFVSLYKDSNEDYDDPSSSRQHSRSSSRSSSSARKQQGSQVDTQPDDDVHWSSSETANDATDSTNIPLPSSPPPLHIPNTSLISNSTAPSDGLDHLRNRRPSWAAPSPVNNVSSAVSNSDSTSIAGVTASEGVPAEEEDTFIHHSNVSDLPPILRPAWQKGPENGALDPRTPGKKRSHVDLKDMFTPLKLQTMFRTPSPELERASGQVVEERDQAHTGLTAVVEQDKVDDARDEEPSPDNLSDDRALPPSTPPKESHPSSSSRLAPHTVFTFRCDQRKSSSQPHSPFAHIGTPKSSAKRQGGLSAEAHAQIAGHASPFAMRLFKFASKEPMHSDEDAQRLFHDRVRELASEKAAQQHHQSPRRSHKRALSSAVTVTTTRTAEPEKKRIRIEKIVVRHTSDEGDDYATTAITPTSPRSPLRLSPRKLPPVQPDLSISVTIEDAQRHDESPRKIFQRFSAERALSTHDEQNEIQELQASTSEEDRQRDAAVAAIEEKIRQRRLARGSANRPTGQATSPHRIVSDPPKLVVVDENGKSESLPVTAGANAAGPSTTSNTNTWRTTFGSQSQSRGSSSSPRITHISPDRIQTQEIVNTFGRGKMAFDASSNRWIKSPSKKERPTAQNVVMPIEQSHSHASSDSTDPFKDIESFGSGAQHESTPPPRPARPRTRTPPILQPRYALQQQIPRSGSGTGSPAQGQIPKIINSGSGSAPRSGSALRNEVTIAESDESMSVASISGDATDARQNQIDAEEPPPTRLLDPHLHQPSKSQATTPVRGGASASSSQSTTPHPTRLLDPHPHQPSKSQATTPVRGTSGSSSQSTTPHPPRSILKSAQSSIASRHPSDANATPIRATRQISTPRSISFADGKTTGKMFAASIGRDGDQPPSALPPPGGKEERIQQLLQELASLALGDKADAVLRGLEDQLVVQDDEAEDDSWQAPSPTSRFSQLGVGPAASSNTQTPLSFSHFSRASSARGAGRSVWDFDESAGDKTFLTQASFNVAHDRIVETITDVAPWVPDWDDLKEIDLSGRRLESVVRLKEFLPNLASIVLDDNRIEYLTGLPATLRALSVARNSIPATISLSHLRHLETLDISHNAIDDLSSLECLVHLRHLRADCNGIRSLNGINELDHLHTLSLRGNNLTLVNLQDSTWRGRLTVLDLSHNRLLTVRGLSSCRHLRVLNLTGNQLSRVDLGHSMPKLQVLRVSGNASLDKLDVLPAKDLRTLYADFCSLTKVDHLGSLTMLENLSVRQQGLSSGKPPDSSSTSSPRHGSLRRHTQSIPGFQWPATSASDIRRLFMSGNPLSNTFATALTPTDPFGLLVYLELSACQIETLPAHFSDTFPALHQLNLDYNLVSRFPLGCFSGCTNLKRVSMVGCRIKRTRNLVEAFEGCETLCVLDTRLNPITLGLYPPMMMASDKDVSPSLAHLAPIPQPQTTRPDTVHQDDEEAQAEAQEQYEQSFFHKKHARPQRDSQAEKDQVAMPTSSSSSSSAYWAQADTRFAQTLPQTFALKRMLHRGSLGLVCVALQWLDGLPLAQDEVDCAEEFLLLQEEDGQEGG